jgi:acyl carrier protein
LLDNRNSDDKIISFYVSDEKISSMQLRKYLRNKLPEYMIPSSFVKIDTIPLTPNGKINRNALLRDNVTENEFIDDFVSPSTELEKELAAIWQEKIGVSRVGLNDNFFDLGGHSLLVYRVISVLKDKFGIEPEFRDFFNQTFGQFATTYEQRIKRVSVEEVL